MLGSSVEDPTQLHMLSVNHFLQYLKGTTEWMIIMHAGKNDC